MVSLIPLLTIFITSAEILLPLKASKNSASCSPAPRTTSSNSTPRKILPSPILIRSTSSNLPILSISSISQKIFLTIKYPNLKKQLIILNRTSQTISCFYSVCSIFELKNGLNIAKLWYDFLQILRSKYS